MDSISKIMLEIYAPQFESTFQHHPNKDEILAKIQAGDNPPELVDLWFAEAEHYTWENFKQATPPVNSDGTVTFKVVN